jgi:hypothetical protein
MSHKLLGQLGEEMHDDTVDTLSHKDAMHRLECGLKNKFDFSKILADARAQRRRK